MRIIILMSWDFYSLRLLDNCCLSESTDNGFKLSTVAEKRDGVKAGRSEGGRDD